MKTYFKILPVLLLMAGLFTYLFYEGGWGVNVFAFDAVLLLTVLRLRPELGRRGSFRWAVAALFTSATAAVVVSSRGSLLAHSVSFVLLIGFAQERELRFVWLGLILGGISLITAPWRAWRQRSKPLVAPERRAGIGRWLRQSAGPIALALPFFALYAMGSSNFLAGVEWFSGPLFTWMGDTSLPYTLVLGALGLTLSLPFFYTANEESLTAIRPDYDKQLVRTRKRKLLPFTPISLRAEYRRGIMTLLLLNVLIFITNLTDLGYLWIKPRQLSAAILSEYVHAGTYSLVLSILLAMGVVLFFFRDTLNFYPGAKPLRRLTYLWLAQNTFLAFSVGLRNWYYVSAYGLAYGRIYVAFVLLLIIFGLLTLFRKVKFRLSFTYLLQVNGLAMWLFLIAFGAVNWPGVITRTNLRQPTEQVDWAYLTYGLGDANTFLLRRHLDRMPQPLQRVVIKKEEALRTEYLDTDWRGRNYPLWRNR